jgi:hypothetical protein
VSNDLLGHFVGFADQQCAMSTSLGVEPRTGDGRPPALLRDIGNGARIAGEEFIASLMGGGGDVA